MLNLIYSGALTTLLVALAFLIQYENNRRINNISRGAIMLSIIAYGVTILLFSESLGFKSTVFIRDISLIFSAMIAFRVIRNSKVLFPILIGMLLFGMSNFGFNYLHDSFKISKFSILKEASASTNSTQTNAIKSRKTSKLSTKSNKK